MHFDILYDILIQLKTSSKFQHFQSMQQVLYAMKMNLKYLKLGLLGKLQQDLQTHFVLHFKGSDLSDLKGLISTPILLYWSNKQFSPDLRPVSSAVSGLISELDLSGNFGVRWGDLATYLCKLADAHAELKA